MKRLSYREGTWFAVPLKDGGYAAGVVARVGRRGVLFGYFFGPRRPAAPSLSDLEGLTPNNAVLVGKFGDLGLLDGRWPIVGKSDSWDREQWPLPVFGRFEDLTGRAFRVEYSEKNLTSPVREVQVLREELHGLPTNGLYGAVAIEAALAKSIRE